MNPSHTNLVLAFRVLHTIDTLFVHHTPMYTYYISYIHFTYYVMCDVCMYTIYDGKNS
jgi:hypothetical protein